MAEADADGDEQQRVDRDVGVVVVEVPGRARELAEPRQLAVCTVEERAEDPQPAAPPVASPRSQRQTGAGEQPRQQAQGGQVVRPDRRPDHRPHQGTRDHVAPGRAAHDTASWVAF